MVNKVLCARIMYVGVPSWNNFRCTDRRPDFYIVCPFHIQEKSERRLAQILTNFVIMQKPSWGWVKWLTNADTWTW